MAPTIVQVPPSEIAKAKQQLESERIQLAKQRREIQSSQNKAAAVKQGIGVAVALGTGALALYKMNEKKKSEDARLASAQADREATAVENEKNRQARAEERSQALTRVLEQRQMQAEERLARQMDTQTAKEGKNQVTNWQMAKDVGTGLITTARTGGALAVQGARAAQTVVNTGIKAGQNIQALGSLTLVVTVTAAYLVPPLRWSIPQAFGEYLGESFVAVPTGMAQGFAAGSYRGAEKAANVFNDAISVPLEFVRGIPAGTYSAGSRAWNSVKEVLHDRDPELSEFMEWHEQKENAMKGPFRTGSGYEGKWGFDPLNQVNASFIPVMPNLNSTIPLTNMTVDELLRTYTNTQTDLSKFKVRGAMWDQGMFDEYQKLPVLEKQEIESRLPRGTLTYLNRKYSQSR